MKPCSHCGSTDTPVAFQKPASVSFGGIVSVLISLLGLLLLLVSPVIGLLTIIAGLIVGLTRPKNTILICPNCKAER